MNDESKLGNQVSYWDTVASQKSFSLPINLPLLQKYLPLESKILDYGCGYGRICEQLAEFGYPDVTGVDSSPQMIARARQMHPSLRFDVGTATVLPYKAGAFNAIFLVAVLTCIPMDDDQQRLIATLGRHLVSGGILYVVDYLLQPDPRNQERYARHTAEFGTYGIFRLEEGGVFRHHDLGWIETLLAGFTLLDLAYVDVMTMNGNPARAFQYCCQKKD